jgi:hypothetical protein
MKIRNEQPSKQPMNWLADLRKRQSDVRQRVLRQNFFRAKDALDFKSLLQNPAFPVSTSAVEAF